ncbi:serine/threonine-protein kinase BRSK2-like [Oscarella lobularis]|uniref:serine/threonine-protein kinase BRSK2-like n=1 Tax=Oscarella lobularis TaxID=121494 RepID=UPI003313D7B4
MDVSDVGSRSVGPYVVGRTLGKGQTGHVKLGTHCATGQTVAIKTINKRQLSESILKKVEREIAIMKLIDHPHVLGLFDVYENATHLYLILEHVTGGELFDYLVQKGRLSEREARQFFRQILSAVDFCHAHCIVHRDLKPENLLLDSEKKIKVADFGMASLQLEDDLLQTSCGSPHYACPEVIRGISYDGRKADIWSCGVILFALVVGSLPFDDRQGNLRALLEKVKVGDFYMPSGLSAPLQHLIRGMICVNANKRMTINDVMKHPWILHTSAPDLDPEIPIKDAVQTAVIAHRSDIDRDILASMLRLGCFKFRGELVHRLLSRNHNIEKVIYFLLQKRKEAQPCNDDDSDNPDEDSDTNRPRKRVDTTPLPQRKIGIYGTPSALRRTTRTTTSFKDEQIPAYVTPQQSRHRFRKISYQPPNSPIRSRIAAKEKEREKKSPAPDASSLAESREVSADSEIFSVASKPADTGSEAVASPSPTTTSSHEGSFVKKKFTFRRVFESPKFHRKKFSQVQDSDSETGSQGADETLIKRSWFTNLLKHDRQEIFMVVKEKKFSVLKADIVRTLLALNVHHTVVSNTEFELKYSSLKNKGKRRPFFSKAVKFRLTIGIHCEPKSNIHTITMKLSSGSSRRFKRIAESIQAFLLNPPPKTGIPIQLDTPPSSSSIREQGSPDTSDIEDYLTDSSSAGTPAPSPVRRVTLGAGPANGRF